MCKNKKALLGGKCVTSQTCYAERGTVFGSGNFGRRCLVPAASRCASTPGWMSTAGNNCATYELGLNTYGLEVEPLCTSKGGATAAYGNLMAAIHNSSGHTYTFNDDADGDGLTANDACCACGGRGSAKIETVPITTPAAIVVPRDAIPCAGKKTDVGTQCQCGANCHTCTVGPTLEIIVGQCSVCKNKHSLFEGNCITGDFCKSSTIKGTVQGSGNFNRKCIVLQTSGDRDGGDDELNVCKGRFTDAPEPQPCTCPSNCHTCQSSVCLKCKNKQALSGGQCITTSACSGAGGTVRGAGNFNRKCILAGAKQTTAATPKRTTAAPCPTDALKRFKNARVGVRLKGAAALASDLKAGGDSKFPSVPSAGVCAAHCIAYGSACKAFELKARGGQLRCNLMSSNSAFGTSVVTSAKFDLYERSHFCD